MAAQPNPTPLSPRRRMLNWVRENRDLDMVSLRVKAVETFWDDPEMVGFALGQVAVWEAANLGHLARKRSMLELLRNPRPDGRSAAAEFLSRFPQAVRGRYWEIANMTRPMLAESIIRREREVHGELKVLAVSKEVHDLLTDDRTTVAAFFAANKERREALVDIIRRYE